MASETWNPANQINQLNSQVDLLRSELEQTRKERDVFERASWEVGERVSEIQAELHQAEEWLGRAKQRHEDLRGVVAVAHNELLSGNVKGAVSTLERLFDTIGLTAPRVVMLVCPECQRGYLDCSCHGHETIREFDTRCAAAPLVKGNKQRCGNGV